MDSLASSPTLAALHAARRLLADANLAALGLRRRVEVLAHATDWRSHATDGYRAGMASLGDDLIRLITLIDLFDGDLAAAQHAEVTLALPRW